MPRGVLLDADQMRRLIHLHRRCETAGDLDAEQERELGDLCDKYRHSMWPNEVSSDDYDNDDSDVDDDGIKSADSNIHRLAP